MKAFNRIFATVTAAVILLSAVVNLILAADRTDGSGLGLYICRQLMRRMGGEIFAQIDSDIITVTAVFARA